MCRNIDSETPILMPSARTCQRLTCHDFCPNTSAFDSDLHHGCIWPGTSDKDLAWSAPRLEFNLPAVSLRGAGQ